MEYNLVSALKRIAEDGDVDSDIARLSAAIERLVSAEPAQDDAEFESKHPRGKGGKFAHSPSASEKEALERGEDPGGNYKEIEASDLPTLSKVTNSKYRNLRNEVKKEIDRRIAANPNDDAAMGTYDVSTGKPVKQNLNSGFQVSFQTTGGEGFNGNNALSDKEYDDTVEQLMKETESKPYVGYYGGIPEISFTCKTLKQAMEIGNRFNQHTVCNNKRAAQGVFDDKTFMKCPMYSCLTNQLHKYVNKRSANG